MIKTKFNQDLRRILIIVLILLFTAVLPINAEIKVHFIDIGQGDAILIQENEEHNVLIDGGNRWNSVEEKMINYLEKNNVEKIDALISTHAHADHIGSLEAVINNFEVEQVYDPGKIHTSKTFENYLIAIDKNNIAFDTPRRNEEIIIGNLNFKVLHPVGNVERYSLNNSSIVLKLNYKNISFLFTGDIEKEVERDILEDNLPLNATILKVAHHGSSTSSSKDFIEEVSPETAVIQVGRDNKFGHPDQSTIKHFKEENIKILRNDLNGDIVISSNGNSYDIKTERSQSKTDSSKINNNNNTASDNKSADQNKININTASASQLENLWGVGPATAENIIEYRENNNGFESIEEIKNVNGIGEAKFERWKDKITL